MWKVSIKFFLVERHFYEIKNHWVDLQPQRGQRKE